MTDATNIAATLAEILRRLSDLENSSQIQHSTVQVDGVAVPVPTGIGAGVAAGEAIPGLTADLEQARVEVEAAGQAADAAVIAAAQASADVASAQVDIDAALADIDGRVSQASAAALAASQRADAAQTAADAADQAARDAAGVAAGKGLTIFQGSAPTGARAVPENLWINTTGGANTPNRYDTATTQWVPITDKAATDAASAAVTAQSAAQAAQTAATNAKTAADNAQSTATAAGVAAKAADDKAAAARTAADSAATNAATAQTAATNAKTAADAADARALAAAGVADSKGKVLFQVTAPTGANAVVGNLWIDTTSGKNTPNRYDATQSKWVPVTDKAATDAASAAAAAQTSATNAGTAASTAQAAADAAKGVADAAKAAAATAQVAADAAKAAASTAQVTANGKNTITYRATPPTTSDVGTTVGDVWFIRSTATGILTGQYEWTGPTNGWQQRTVGDLLIANLDAGKLTAGYIASARIAADTIIATMLAADAVLARNIKAGEIIAGKLAVDSVVAENIVAATITGDKLLANTITAREIKAGEITADLLSADAINGKTITGVTITGSSLRTAATGRSVRIANDRITLMNQYGNVSGSIYGNAETSSTIEQPGIVISTSAGDGENEFGIRVGTQFVDAENGIPVASTVQMGTTRIREGKYLYTPSIRTSQIIDHAQVGQGGTNLIPQIPNQMFVANQVALPAATVANGSKVTKRTPPVGTRIIRKLKYQELSLNASGLPASRLAFDSAFPNECLGVFMTTIFGSGIAPVLNGGNIDRTGFGPIWAGQGATTVGLLYEAIGW